MAKNRICSSGSARVIESMTGIIKAKTYDDGHTTIQMEFFN